MKKLITLLLLVGLSVGLLVYNFTIPEPENGETEPVALTADTEPTQTPDPPEPAPGQVRILNHDPQLQAAWETLAAEYTGQTGTEVTVLTAEDEAQPTLLTVDAAETLPASCVDLSGAEAYAQLDSWDLSVRAEDGTVCGIAAEVEVFGLLYNSTLLSQVGYTRADMGSFANLTEVVATITDASQQLGFSAFARVDPSYNFAIQLASLTGDSRSFLDLFINNATCDPAELSSCTEEEALGDFLNGKAVFFLARSSEHEALQAIGSENIGVLPVYMGGVDEERQSLCAAARSYWCVSGEASEADIQVTLEFLDFLVQPREDGTVPVDDLALLAPYRQAAWASNSLEIVMRNDLAAGRELLVCRPLSGIPEGLADALIAYAADPSDDNWSAVTAILEE